MARKKHTSGLKKTRFSESNVTHWQTEHYANQCNKMKHTARQKVTFCRLKYGLSASKRPSTASLSTAYKHSKPHYFANRTWQNRTYIIIKANETTKIRLAMNVVWKIQLSWFFTSPAVGTSENKLKNKTKGRAYTFMSELFITFAAAKTGKSCTASSLRILQGLIAAKVVGCSGAI